MVDFAVSRAAPANRKTCARARATHPTHVRAQKLSDQLRARLLWCRLFCNGFALKEVCF